MDSEECLLEGGKPITADICLTKSEISRKNQAKGIKFEEKILARLERSNCIVAMRSSGSRGLWDLICVAPDKVRVIQAKTQGYLGKKERKIMLSDIQKMPDFVQAEVEYYKSPKVNVNFTLKKAFETDWARVEERINKFKTSQGIKEESPSQGMKYIFGRDSRL